VASQAADMSIPEKSLLKHSHRSHYSWLSATLEGVEFHV
jgi:hypothetical protein